MMLCTCSREILEPSLSNMTDLHPCDHSQSYCIAALYTKCNEGIGAEYISTYACAHPRTHIFAATASDGEPFDGEDGTEVADKEGMQVAVRSGGSLAEQSEDEEGEGEEMEVLDPSHVSLHDKQT